MLKEIGNQRGIQVAIDNNYSTFGVSCAINIKIN